MKEITAAMPVSQRAVSLAADTRYVEWSAVWAGGALAAAISFVLLAFGTAIGLSFVAPWPDSSIPIGLIASAAIFWTMAQQIGAAMVGGYVAGRMRSRWGEASEHEVEFRDGLHGGLVWAVGVIIVGTLLLMAAGSASRTGAEIAGRTAGSTALLDSTVDRLFRPMNVAAKPSTTSSAGSQSATYADTRAAVVRTVGAAIARGGLTEPDRAYLGVVVAEATGLAQADAEKRVSDLFAEANTAAREATDKVRRASILTGFVTAAGLLIALCAAWWAAQRGGHHRDNRIPARFVMAKRITG